MSYINAQERLQQERVLISTGNPVLPEAIHCAANEVFLVLHRAHVNPLMEQDAALFAQTPPPREISNLDDGTLTLHYYTRVWLLGMSKKCLFQTLVDQSCGVISNTKDAVSWVKPSLIWVPHFDGIVGPIYHALVKRYEECFFAERCYAELVRRGRENPYMKHTFIQLTDDPDLYQERNEGSEWLREASRRIATSVGAQPEVGEDVKQDWLAELFPLPLHRQIQEVRSTGIEIKHRAYDIQHRKGGQHKPTHLDDEIANTMPDKSAKDPSERMLADEIPQRLLECQPQIEEILSQGRPEKRKQGERRFKVMQLLAHTPNLTSSAIANQLRTSEPTISRDRKVIEQSRDRIKEILHG